MKKALQVGRLSPHVALCLKMYICEDPSYFMNFSTGWCLWVLLPAFFFFFSHQPCLRRPFLYCKMKTANWTGKKQTRHSWVFIWPLSYASATLGSEAFMTCSTAMHKWESRSRHFDFRIEQLLWMYVHLFLGYMMSVTLLCWTRASDFQANFECVGVCCRLVLW